jgi:quercetin dioxygenase-like cupin family protein
MALPHAAPGQVIDLFAAQDTLPTANSFALFKSEQLELIRVVLPAGKTFRSHHVEGEITVQCLTGAIDFDIEGRSQILRAGQLLHLAGGIEHGLIGIEDASALMTIVLCKP